MLINYMIEITISSVLGGSIVINNSTAIILGVCIGVVISSIGIGCYYYYRRSEKYEETENILNRNTEELLNRKVHIDKLNSSDIVEWFKNNVIEGSETNYVVSRPIERVLTGLGCKVDRKIYGDNTLIQMIYDTESKKAIKIRLIEYNIIETNLETQIDENDGFMVVTL